MAGGWVGRWVGGWVHSSALTVAWTRGASFVTSAEPRHLHGHAFRGVSHAESVVATLSFAGQRAMTEINRFGSMDEYAM